MIPAYVLAATAPRPLEGEREGWEMLYPSGATDQLPREPNGELCKRLLRERYWAGHGSLVI